MVQQQVLNEYLSVLIVDGIDLEIKYFIGEENKPTLIFLHEGLGCVEMWRDFPEKLSELTGCPTLVYSRQGYGRSSSCEVPRPLTYMQDEGLKVLPEIIRVTGIQEHILIGHSDGGSIALINAGGKSSSGLLGVVTMAAHTFCEDLSISSIKLGLIAYTDGNLRSGLEKYHHDNVDCAFWGWNNAWLDADFITFNIEKFLPNIKVPQLVIQGQDDPYGTIKQVESIANKSAGYVEVCMFKNCKHSPYKDKATESIALINLFITKKCLR
ncbi:MAG: pimeloyl-ACP methyl ester carboxylesterase [Paraglaciecola sp.]|jgi:pimeloyl-ACP methyl ester carboxylesterase